MTEEEKVREITLYVMKNLKYDIKAMTDTELTAKYNKNPLKCALEGK